MRRRGIIVLFVWAAGCVWLGCNALLGNESAVFDPDGGGVMTTESGPNEGGGSETGPGVDGSPDGAPHDAATDVVVHPCSDTTVDRFNCGTCGHDCLGGGCVDSRCQPVVIAIDPGGPVGLAVDATHVYWTTSFDSDVRRAPIDGGAAETIYDGPTGTSLGEGLVRSGTDVYFTIGDVDGGVYRCPATGCGVAGPQPVVAPLAAPQFVGLADGGVLLFSELAFDGRVGRCTLPCTSGVTFLAAGEGFPGFVASDGDALFWSTIVPSGGNLRAKEDAGGVPTTLVAGQSVRQVEVRGAEVLFANGAGLRAVARDGGAVRKIFELPATPIERFAIEGNVVYFNDQLSVGSIQRCPVVGCADAGSVVLAASQAYPHAVVIDEKSVYWTNSGDPINGAGGAIVRVAK
jgi:hypothetical protein